MKINETVEFKLQCQESRDVLNRALSFIIEWIRIYIRRTLKVCKERWRLLH